VSDDLRFHAATIRKGGDHINVLVNLWIDGANAVYNAVLPVNALGICGEPAKAEYERIRVEAYGRMNDANNAAISIREAIYRTAENYAGAEEAASGSVNRIKPPMPTHRSDIDNPPM
jgi:hypothetical protein